MFLAAVALTYLFCIRPMRRGECGMSSCAPDDAEETRRREDIRRLREEIAQVRSDLGKESAPPKTP